MKSSCSIVALAALSLGGFLGLLNSAAGTPDQSDPVRIDLVIEFMNPDHKDGRLGEAIEQHMETFVEFTDASAGSVADLVMVLFLKQDFLAVSTTFGKPMPLELPAGKLTVREWLALAQRQQPFRILVSETGVLQFVDDNEDEDEENGKDGKVIRF